MYLGFSFLLFELVKILSGRNKRVFLPRMIVLLLLLIIHLLFIFIIPVSYRHPAFILLLFFLTSLFTLVAGNLKAAFNRNLIQNLLKSNYFVLTVFICNLDEHAKALVKLKEIIPLLLNKNPGAEEMLEKINSNPAIKNYLLWNKDVLAVLHFTNRIDLTLSYYNSLDIDLSKPGIPLHFISIVINILIKQDRYDEILSYFHYLQEHYMDIQHWQVVLSLYLSFYAYSGCSENFNLLLEKYPLLKNNPLTTYLRAILCLKTGQEKQGLSILDNFKATLTDNHGYFLPQVNKILDNPGLYSKLPARKAEIACTVLPPEGKDRYLPGLQSKTPETTNGVFILCGIVVAVTLVQFVLSLLGTGFDFITFKYVVPMDFITSGAYSDFYINQGQWGRLLTAVFLHAGWLHLLLNIYGLFITGRYVERTLGSFCMIFIFLASGITGNIASHIISPYPLSLGASGGVFGLLASVFTYVIWQRKYMNRAVLTNFIINFIIIIGINILFGLNNPHINNTAHFGGFAGGALITLLFLLGNKIMKTSKLTNYISRIFVILCTCLLLVSWPNYFTYDYFNKLDLDKQITLSGFTFQSPSLWEIETEDNNPGIMRDTLTRNKTGIVREQGSFDDEEIQALLSEDNYGKDYELENPGFETGNGWYAYTLKKKVNNQKYYDIITIYNKRFSNSYCLVFSYKMKKYSKGFDELLQRVLATVLE